MSRFGHAAECGGDCRHQREAQSSGQSIGCHGCARDSASPPLLRECLHTRAATKDRWYDATGASIAQGIHQACTRPIQRTALSPPYKLPPSVCGGPIIRIIATTHTVTMLRSASPTPHFNARAEKSESNPLGKGGSLGCWKREEARGVCNIPAGSFLQRLAIVHTRQASHLYQSRHSCCTIRDRFAAWRRGRNRSSEQSQGRGVVCYICSSYHEHRSVALVRCWCNASSISSSLSLSLPTGASWLSKGRWRS